MESNKTLGAKAGLQSMIYYYLTALVESGVQDPKQKIATDMAGMIDLSEEQLAYVGSHLTKGIRFEDELKSSIDLLKGMQRSNKLDKETLQIVIAMLEEGMKQLEDAIDNYTLDTIGKENNNGRQNEDEKPSGNDSRSEQEVREGSRPDSQRDGETG